MPCRWFVLRVQSNKEDRVRSNLQKRVKAAGLDDTIREILVPTEQVTEIRSGRRRIAERKIYPGYVMIQMEVGEDNEVSEEAWYLVRETPGIGDFIGAERRPVPMADHEVDKILGEAERTEEAPRLMINFKEGDSVKVREGPFENFDGVVEEVNATKGLVKVIVTIFGRATPVELEYWQVEPI